MPVLLDPLRPSSGRSPAGPSCRPPAGICGRPLDRAARRSPLVRLLEGLGGLCPARRSTRAPDAGMATAEYAIATLAACGFAGLLLVLMRSDEVRGLLSGIVQRALSVG